MLSNNSLISIFLSIGFHVQGKGIDIPSGNILIKNVHAVGTQNYFCKSNKYLFKDADATLLRPDDRKNIEGKHYFNTTPDAKGGRSVFEIQGSKAVFKDFGNDISVNSKNIPELIRASTSTTPGFLQLCTFLQRINTVGGVKPTDGPCKDGNVVKISYEADYSFYAKGSGTTAGSTPSDNPIASIPVSQNGITVPTGNSPITEVQGRGTRNYLCVNGKFVFKDANAELFSSKSPTKRVGDHFFLSQPDLFGGTAVFVIDDSTAVFKYVDDGRFPSKKDIADALFAATSTTPGTLGDCTFAQRLGSRGGVPPTRACTNGEIDKVNYTANYVFFAPNNVGRR